MNKFIKAFKYHFKMAMRAIKKIFITYPKTITTIVGHIIGIIIVAHFMIKRMTRKGQTNKVIRCKWIIKLGLPISTIMKGGEAFMKEDLERSIRKMVS